MLYKYVIIFLASTKRLYELERCIWRAKDEGRINSGFKGVRYLKMQFLGQYWLTERLGRTVQTHFLIPQR